MKKRFQDILGSTVLPHLLVLLVRDLTKHARDDTSDEGEDAQQHVRGLALNSGVNTGSNSGAVSVGAMDSLVLHRAIVANVSVLAVTSVVYAETVLATRHGALVHGHSSGGGNLGRHSVEGRGGEVSTLRSELERVERVRLVTGLTIPVLDTHAAAIGTDTMSVVNTLLGTAGSLLTGAALEALVTVADTKVTDTLSVTVVRTSKRTLDLTGITSPSTFTEALSEQALATRGTVAGTSGDKRSSANHVTVGSVESILTSALVVDADTVVSTSTLAIVGSVDGSVLLGSLLGIKNIVLEELGLLSQRKRDVAILTGPSGNAETVTISTDTVLSTAIRAGDLLLTSLSDESGLAEALSEAADTTARTSMHARILGLDGTVLTGTSFDTEAASHVADTPFGTVVGASEVGQRSHLASSTRVSGQTTTLSLHAHTVSGTGKRGSGADNLFGTVRSLESGKTVALSHEAETLILHTTSRTRLVDLTELSSSTGSTEALVVAAHTTSVTDVLRFSKLLTGFLSDRDGTVLTLESFHTVTSSELTHTVSGTVALTRRVKGLGLTRLSLETDLTVTLASSADTAAVTVVGTRGLTLTVFSFESEVTVATSVLALSVARASERSALGLNGAVVSLETGLTEASSSGVEADTVSVTFTVVGSVTLTGGGGVTVGAIPSGVALTSTIDADTLSSVLGDGTLVNTLDVTELTRVSGGAETATLTALTVSVTLVGASNLRAVLSRPLILTLADSSLLSEGVIRRVEDTATMVGGTVVGTVEGDLTSGSSVTREASTVSVSLALSVSRASLGAGLELTVLTTVGVVTLTLGLDSLSIVELHLEGIPRLGEALSVVGTSALALDRDLTVEATPSRLTLANTITDGSVVATRRVDLTSSSNPGVETLTGSVNTVTVLSTVVKTDGLLATETLVSGTAATLNRVLVSADTRTVVLISTMKSTLTGTVGSSETLDTLTDSLDLSVDGDSALADTVTGTAVGASEAETNAGSVDNNSVATLTLGDIRFGRGLKDGKSLLNKHGSVLIDLLGVVRVTGSVRVRSDVGLVRVGGRLLLDRDTRELTGGTRVTILTSAEVSSFVLITSGTGDLANTTSKTVAGTVMLLAVKTPERGLTDATLLAVRAHTSSTAVSGAHELRTVILTPSELAETLSGVALSVSRALVGTLRSLSTELAHEILVALAASETIRVGNKGTVLSTAGLADGAEIKNGETMRIVVIVRGTSTDSNETVKSGDVDKSSLLTGKRLGSLVERGGELEPGVASDAVEVNIREERVLELVLTTIDGNLVSTEDGGRVVGARRRSLGKSLSGDDGDLPVVSDRIGDSDGVEVVHVLTILVETTENVESTSDADSGVAITARHDGIISEVGGFPFSLLVTREVDEVNLLGSGRVGVGDKTSNNNGDVSDNTESSRVHLGHFDTRGGNLAPGIVGEVEDTKGVGELIRSRDSTLSTELVNLVVVTVNVPGVLVGLEVVDRVTIRKADSLVTPRLGGELVGSNGRGALNRSLSGITPTPDVKHGSLAFLDRGPDSRAVTGHGLGRTLFVHPLPAGC